MAKRGLAPGRASLAIFFCLVYQYISASSPITSTPSTEPSVANKVAAALLETAVAPLPPFASRLALTVASISWGGGASG